MSRAMPRWFPYLAMYSAKRTALTLTFNADLSERLDAKISEIADAGHEVISVAPLSCNESAMSVLVTYK